MSKEAPHEQPTFDPFNLPSERIIAMENETDFMLLAEGMTPDEIAELMGRQREGKDENEPEADN